MINWLNIEKINITKRKLSNVLLGLFVFSIIIHTVIVLFFIDLPIGLDDMFQYDMLGRSLRNGNGFRWYAASDVKILEPYYSQFLDLDRMDFPENGLITVFRAPGYPFFLAGIYLFFDGVFRLKVVRLIHVLLISLLSPFSGYLAYKLNLNIKTIIISGLITALYPVLLFYPIGLVSENLYIVLGMGCILLSIIAVVRKEIKYTVITGVCAGLLMLTRSIFAISIVFIGIWMIIYRESNKKYGLIFLAVAFLICMPWAIRNSVIVQKPAFVENSMGYNLYIGYHPEGNGGFVPDIAIKPLNILADRERDEYCLHQAVTFISENPLSSITRIFTRIGMFFGIEIREFTYFYTNNYIGKLGNIILYGIIMLLTIPWLFIIVFGPIGLFSKIGEKNSILVFFFILFYSIPHLIILAEPRFHLSLVPMLIPYALIPFSNQNRKTNKRLLKIRVHTLLDRVWHHGNICFYQYRI